MNLAAIPPKNNGSCVIFFFLGQNKTKIYYRNPI